MEARMAISRCMRGVLVTLTALLLLPLLAAPAAADRRAPALDWTECGDGFECATFRVPRDYADPSAGKLSLAVTRLPATDPANRIGSLFINFGGPGGPGVETLQAIPFIFATLNDRFDLVSWDPRGVGQSEPAVDCHVDQERAGLYAQPFTTPETFDFAAWAGRSQAYVRACLDNNRGILPYISTANTARDLDGLRAAVGDAKLTYLGFSYGTFVGATYASMFPNRYRALVLDGALDADQYINEPTAGLQEQSQGFEVALARFFQACAAHKDVCPFGGDDPAAAFDDLIAAADASPIPASIDPLRPVDGDDLRAAGVQSIYAKQLWPLLAIALTEAQAGDATLARLLVDSFYGRLEDGTYDAFADRYFAIGAVEQRYEHDFSTYIKAGKRSYGLFEHAYWNTGYVELPYGLWPVRPRGVFYGPFRASRSAPTVLVVGTRYDPATPYKGSKRLVGDLGNARLLTMRGDGHTAYANGSPTCIDPAVDAYLETLTLPAPGTICQQDVPFALPEPVTATPAGAQALLRRLSKSLMR
jgi:pimeloyl-ACP methyl ester carboxylesterase